MDSRRIALLTVAICAIGIFALPGTVSLFSGQHSWYDLSAGQNDVPCEKCHQDIADEMISGGSDGNGVHRNMTCALCHRTCFNTVYNPGTGLYESAPRYIYASGEGNASTAGKETHAAATVACMDCHAANDDEGVFDHNKYSEYNYELYDETCYRCHIKRSTMGQDGFIAAGGFGMTGRVGDTGERAAHMDFVLDSINDTLMEDANEACIACHTRIGVNITWRKSTTLHFDASETHNGTWLIDVFTVHGYNYTNSTYPNNWTNSY